MTLYPHLRMVCGLLLSFLSVLFAHHTRRWPRTTTTTSKNDTISLTLPAGARVQGSHPQLLCTPSKWTDVAAFLLANYVAHIATVKMLPGESVFSSLKTALLALIFPASGVRRGVNAIWQRAIFAKTPLQVAAKANALCIVIRAPDWRPMPGDVAEVTNSFRASEVPWWYDEDELDYRGPVTRAFGYIMRRFNEALRIFTSAKSLIFGDLSYPMENMELSEVPAYMVQPFHANSRLRNAAFDPSSSRWNLYSRAIYGVCRLPPGYTLRAIPYGTRVVEIDEQAGPNQHINDRSSQDEAEKERDTSIGLDEKASPSPIQLSPVYNLGKGLIAILQVLYASFTLYQTRGDQIQRYGYAAFGLTVTPYLIMSIINLASSLFTPDYPTVCLVESEIMLEAKRRGNCEFTGCVGRVLPEQSERARLMVRFDINDDGKMIAIRLEDDTASEISREEVDFMDSNTRIDTFEGLAPSVINKYRPCRFIARGEELCLDHIPWDAKPPSVFDTPFAQEPADIKQYLLNGLSLILACAPLIVNGTISRFQPQQSSRAERALTMMWLVFGITAGNLGKYSLVKSAMYIAPAIGGFVIVCQMILQYGTCIKLD